MGCLSVHMSVCLSDKSVQATPTTLSTEGKMRIGDKADLLLCLRSDLLGNNSAPVAEAILLNQLIAMPSCEQFDRN